MKHCKKLLAGLIAFALLCGMGIPAGAKETKLQYGSDGAFRILVFTDTHQQKEDQPVTYTFMDEAIVFTQPDLVVLNGDIVVGSATENAETMRSAIKRISAPIVKHGVPFALVYGNHDYEYKGKAGRKELMKMWQSIPGSLIRDDDPKNPGQSSYNLPVYGGKNSSKVISNLWFFDSGDYAEVGGYDWVRKEQIDWYVSASQKLRRQNGGVPVPAVAFQHIIVPEIYDCFLKSPVATDSNVYKGIARLPIPDYRKMTGAMLEPPCPPYYTDGQFDAWVEQGDIFAAVFGHDHVNDFIARIDGIELRQVPDAGYGVAYGADANRGATLITLTESRPCGYDVQPITYRQLAARPESNIGNAHVSGEAWQWLLFGAEVWLQSIIFAGQLARNIF